MLHPWFPKSQQVPPFLVWRLALGFFIIPLIIIGQEEQSSFYPVRNDRHWGFMDATGQLIISPSYDAIGQIKGDHATILKDGFMGVIHRAGTEIIPPRYRLLFLLGHETFTYQEGGAWGISTFQGDSISPPVYEEVANLDPGYLRVRKSGRYGVVSFQGREILPCQYEAISSTNDSLFIVYEAGERKLLNAKGQTVAFRLSGEIRRLGDVLFYRENEHWGAWDQQGKSVLQTEWEDFAVLDRERIKLRQNGKWALFHIGSKTLLCKPHFDDYRVLDRYALVVRDGDRYGLMRNNGQSVTSCQYDEIKPSVDSLYSVRQGGKWGLAGLRSGLTLPPTFDYIFRFRHSFAVVMQGNKFGLLNQKGKLALEANYQYITVSRDLVKAYRMDGQIELLSIDSKRKLSKPELVQEVRTLTIGNRKKAPKAKKYKIPDADRFAWFFDSKQKKWGLRDLQQRKVHIPPTYAEIYLDESSDLTLTACELQNRSSQANGKRYAFGVVDHRKGRELIRPMMAQIFLEDLGQTDQSAFRCVRTNGRYELRDRKGKLLGPEQTYIGCFSNGTARFYAGGKLTKSTTDSIYSLGDYKQYKESLYHRVPQQLVEFSDERQQLVAKQGHWGLMNTNGQLIMEPDFDFLSDPAHLPLLAQVGKKWGVVSTKADTILRFLYEEIRFLPGSNHQLLELVSNQSRYGLIDRKGRFRTSLGYRTISFPQEGLIRAETHTGWGFLDTNGREVIPFKLKAANNFQEGFAAVKKGRKWGFIDYWGDEHIPLQYQQAASFQDQRARVRYNGKWIYIDQSGKQLFKKHFAQANDFLHGHALVKEKARYGLIDTLGRWAIRPKFRSLKRSPKSTMIKAQRKFTYGWLDEAGNTIAKPKYNVLKPYQEGISIAMRKGNAKLLDTAGKETAINTHASLFAPSEGLIRFRKRGHYGFMDLAGQVVIAPRYSKANDFSEGLAPVRNRGRWGAINMQGDTLVKFVFRELGSYTQGMAIASDSADGVFFVDQLGQMLFGQRFDQAHNFQFGLAPVMRNEQWGMINTNGLLVIPAVFDDLEISEDGWIAVQCSGKHGVADLKGQLIADVAYQRVSMASPDLIRLENELNLTYLKPNGTWVWKGMDQ